MNLRDELVESQKMRIDLFKWKIILIAGLGAGASGVGGVQIQHPALLLSLIPLVCMYVDLLSRDQTLRIVSITQYLKLGGNLEGTEKAITENDTVARTYDAFVAKADRMTLVGSRVALCKRLCSSKRSAYAFAFLAQDCSTIAVLMILFLWGLVLWRLIPLSSVFGVNPSGSDGIVLILSSIVGFAGTFFAYLAYICRWVTIEGNFPFDP